MRWVTYTLTEGHTDGRTGKHSPSLGRVRLGSSLCSFLAIINNPVRSSATALCSEWHMHRPAQVPGLPLRLVGHLTANKAPVQLVPKEEGTREGSNLDSKCKIRDPKHSTKPIRCLHSVFPVIIMYCKLDNRIYRGCSDRSLQSDERWRDSWRQKKRQNEPRQRANMSAAHH